MEKKPEWLKVRYNQDAVNEVAALMRETGLARPVVSSMLEAVRESLQDAA